VEGVPPRKVRFNGEITIPTVMLSSSGTLSYAIDASEGLRISRKLVTGYFRSYLNGENIFTESMKDIEKINLIEHK